MKVTITTTLSRRTSISLFPKIALVELDVLGREARRELWHSTPSHSKAGFEPDVVFYALTSVENGSSTLERGNGATTTERPTQEIRPVSCSLATCEQKCEKARKIGPFL